MVMKEPAMTSERDLFEAWWNKEAGGDIPADILKRIADKAWEANDITVRAFLGGLRAQHSTAEPFGYFRADPFGWTDCAATDEGAKALYEAAPQQAPLTDEQRCALVGIPSMLEDYVAAIQKTKDFGAMYFIPDIADAHEALVALLRAHGISAAKETSNG